MTTPPSPGQGGYPGYGQQPGQGYPSNQPYPGQQYPQGGQQYPQGGGQYPPPQNPYGGSPQYPGAGGGPQYPGNYGGGGYGGGMPPGPNQGGSGKGPLIAVVIAAIVVVGGIIATLVVVLGGDDKKDKTASPTNSVSGSPSSAPTNSASAPPTSRPTTTRPTTPRTTSAGTANPDLPSEVQYVDLSKGDCVTLDTVSGTIDKKSCTTTHNGEVVMTYELSGSTYPGEASITEQTETKCTPAMNTAVGGRSDASQFTFTYTYPKQPGWDIGRRKVTCIVKYKSGQTLTKPLR
ncbi:septum formation family protein [Embleya sp. NPDC020886]|uniref:septum formation family protein n=1 Tax=Embleya sp. NPDC020886 TaxID=3363980 RepID=UPI0037968976